MQKPDTTQTTPRSRSATLECCTEPGCESGLRNNYFEGKRLTPDMFRIEQRYLNDRRRLLNRAIHGWGVVYGYAIGVPAGHDARAGKSPLRLRVEAGLALDRCGRELLQVAARDLAVGDLIVIDAKGRRTDLEQVLPPPASRPWNRQYGKDDKDQKPPGRRLCVLVSAHYAEQYLGRISVTDPCRCERHEWDRACETVRYTLRVVPCDECCGGCDCELHCGCGTGPCCDPAEDDKGAARPTQDRTRECLPFERGGCRCLCDHLTQLNPGKDCGGALCEIEEPCARVWVDLTHGVPLACLTVVPDDCGGWTFGEEIDACGPRRLVKRNDLLFDLVRGCDLTRISDIGWAAWHRKQEPVAFDDFSAAFGASAYGQDEYVTNDFWVRFSRPVRESTLRPDCFAVTVMSQEREGNWQQMHRVPIARLEFIPAQPGDPAGHVRGAKLVIAGGWVEDALRGRATVFFGETSVEIEVRGDFILDCNGQPVDANAVGRLAEPTGNGTPGGTFLSTFHVAPREPYARPAARDTHDRVKGASS